MAGEQAFELAVRFTSQSAPANLSAETNGVAPRHVPEKAILRRANPRETPQIRPRDAPQYAQRRMGSVMTLTRWW